MYTEPWAWGYGGTFMGTLYGAPIPPPVTEAACYYCREDVVLTPRESWVHLRTEGHWSNTPYAHSALARFVHWGGEDILLDTFLKLLPRPA